MKKLFVIALVAFSASQSLRAQDDIEFGYFNHMSVGVSVGTDGIGFDLAAPISDYAAVRGGFSFMPTIGIHDSRLASLRHSSYASKADFLSASGTI